MSDILSALTSDMSAAIEDAVETFKKDVEEDATEVLVTLREEVDSILVDLANGTPLDEVLKTKDTVATLYLAGVLAKMGEKEAKAASATQDLLTSISFIVLKALLMKG